MRSLILGLVLCAVCAAPASATRGALLFDAVYTHATVGGVHQHASGVLRDRAGNRLGKFAFTCVGASPEQCTGHGTTPAGRLNVAGPSVRSDALHTWHVKSGTGAYRGARGSVFVDDVAPAETFVLVELRAGKIGALSHGAVSQPAADSTFRQHASSICNDALVALGKLPPFPFSNFDPLNPDPSLLPQVGQFFTGPGDPRPALQAAQMKLNALGSPPVHAREWQRTLTARSDAMNVRTNQDSAALAGDTKGFVATVRAVGRVARRQALAALTFGAARCAP